jgi:aminoglycoside phosphotransferase (APT) family kinase protein
VAKTYSKDKGANAYAAMDALWASPLSTGEVVRLAEPLAYLQADRILIQETIPEDHTFRDLLITTFTGADVGSDAEPRVEAVEDALRMTAAGLAALHGSNVNTGAVFTLDQRIRDAKKLADRFAVPVPAVQAAMRPILELVTERAAAVPADPLVSAHQSFRPAQVLIANGRIGFIDFDGFCRSEPALDVALFWATMKSIGLEALPSQAGVADRRARLAHLEQLCSLFTEAYTRLAPVNLHRVALWETLDLLTNVLNPWAKIKAGRLPATTVALEAHLRDLTG